jgi:hypothetical protein
MSGAILQGVPATTLDTDFWIDLPSRQYMRVLNLCAHLPLLKQTIDLQRRLKRKPDEPRQ